MKHEKFRDLVSQFGELTATQKRQAVQLLQPAEIEESSLAAIELSVDEARTGLRCDQPGATARGWSRGLRRDQCKACSRYFNATTGTPPQGLHHKERWLSFRPSLAHQETVHESANHCGFAASTAFRWCHRFLPAVSQSPTVLKGLVEADETYLLHSCKGQVKQHRQADRPARARGGKAAELPSVIRWHELMLKVWGHCCAPNYERMVYWCPMPIPAMRPSPPHSAWHMSG